MKPMYWPIPALILSLALVACDSTTEPPPPPPPPAAGMIAGSILVEGEALVGVTVSLVGPSSASTVSGAGGTFTFASVPAGQYTVSISAFSPSVQFAQTTNAVTVVGGQTATVSFTGTFVRTASISGTVVASGDAVAGATLTLSGTETATTVSGSTGGFNFDGLRAGTFTVTLSGFAADLTFDVAERQVTVGVGDAATVDFTGIREIPATVRIVAFENDRGFRIGPNVLAGEVVVLVDVDQGTQSVTKVTLSLNGENVGEQVPPPVPAGALAGLLAPQRLLFNVNTTEFDQATGGPRFPNGPGTFLLVVDTQQQGAGASSFTQLVTLVNRDLISGVNFVGGAGGVVSGGRMWWGGGDLNFEIVPVIYDPNRTLSAIDVRAVGESSANGGPSLDLGSGFGAIHRVTGPPFLFTASQALNDGFVEDDPLRGGHTISVVGVFDGNGVNISSDFIPGRATPLEGFFVDFMGPQMPPGTRLKADGVTIFGGEQFSSGVFSLSIATEFGVGGITPQFDARVGGAVVAPDVSSIDDLTERAAVYELILESVVDDLGNQGPTANVAPSGLFGVDRTPVSLTGVVPSGTIVLNPDDDGGDGIADNQILFNAVDPTLADGSPGSGYGTATALGVDGIGLAVDLTSQITPNASGANTLSPFLLGEGTFSFDIAVTDNATPLNTASSSVSFVVDRTNPTSNMGSPLPPGSVLTTAASLTFTVAGSAADANGLASVLVTIRDGNTGPNGADGVCDVTDLKVSVGTGIGQVSANTFDVTAEATGFSRNITVQKAGTGGLVQALCFFIESADSATDVNGNPEPNKSNASARTDIEWF